MDIPSLTAYESTSIYAAAFREAESYKWIESEKRGYDLGYEALREWYDDHWPHFCRRKRLEHLQGHRRWKEFGDDYFGEFPPDLCDRDLLVDIILDRFYHGHENLGILNWAMDWGLPMERVHEILRCIDINRVRMEPIIDWSSVETPV